MNRLFLKIKLKKVSSNIEKIVRNSLKCCNKYRKVRGKMIPLEIWSMEGTNFHLIFHSFRKVVTFLLHTKHKKNGWVSFSKFSISRVKQDLNKDKEGVPTKSFYKTPYCFTLILKLIAKEDQTPFHWFVIF